MAKPKKRKNYTGLKIYATVSTLVIAAGIILSLCAFRLGWVHTASSDTDSCIITEAGGTLEGGDTEADMVYYYMVDDVKLTENITISGNVTLCLNGYTLEGNGDGSVITVSDGAYFVLCDCSSDGSGTITGGSAEDGAGVMVNGTFTMEGGIITGNSATYYGGGICVGSDGTFIMNGGTISENTASTSGGGIDTSGTVIINDGTITGNEAPRGGGVYVGANCAITINGGEITYNTASVNGGGVYSNGGFTMTAGTISNNTASAGSGLYLGTYSGSSSDKNNGMFTMTGGYLGGEVSISSTVTASISGGYLSEETYYSLSDSIAEGYVAELTNEYADFPYAVVLSA